MNHLKNTKKQHIAPSRESVRLSPSSCLDGKMSKTIAIPFHFLVPTILSYSLYYHHVYVTPVQGKLRGFEFGGPFIYITIIANVCSKIYLNVFWFCNNFSEFQYIQVAYFCIALLNDVISSATLKIVKDTLFASLTIPFAFMTTLMYFGISFIDPEMVFPAALRPHFPMWLDICLHSSISIFPIIEILLSRHQYLSRWSNIKILIAGLISYAVWIHVVFYKTGFWVYDIFAQLDDIQRTIFFAASGIIGVSLYFVGEALNYALVGTKPKRTKPHKKKSK